MPLSLLEWSTKIAHLMILFKDANYIHLLSQLFNFL